MLQFASGCEVPETDSKTFPFASLVGVCVRVHREYCTAAHTAEEFSHFIGSHGTMPSGKHRNPSSYDPSTLELGTLKWFFPKK